MWVVGQLMYVNWNSFCQAGVDKDDIVLFMTYCEDAGARHGVRGSAISGVASVRLAEVVDTSRSMSYAAIFQWVVVYSSLEMLFCKCTVD